MGEAGSQEAHSPTDFLPKDQVSCEKLILKSVTLGTSLVVQGLRPHPPNAGAQVQPLVGGLRPCIPHSAA